MSDIHVLPLGDLLRHLQLRQCWCRPDVKEWVPDTMVVHHSADGREYFDEDHESETLQ